MIFGSVRITPRAVETHRDSYLLDTLSVISTRCPLLGAAALFALGFGGFAIAFHDLLYRQEVGIIVIICFVIPLIGLWLGQLKLLSRDLRGSELSGVIWGSYRHLNHTRRAIVTAMQGLDGEGRP